MQKLTISVPDGVHEGLQAVIGARRISSFPSDLARPHVLQQDVEAAYRVMADEETWEREALEWSDELIEDSPSDRR